MASGNKLSARVPGSHAEKITQMSNDLDIAEPDAERKLIKEGLASMGYVNKPHESFELLLYYLRRIGLVLGIVGLILIGYGIFGPRQWSFAGYALVLTGFLGVALEGFLHEYETRTNGKEGSGV